MNTSFEIMMWHASDLCGGSAKESDNPEYVRGMCELIARCFPVKDVMTDERAEEIEELLK